MKLNFWFKPLLIVSALSLCFFYVWGCSFGSSSGGTLLNPLGPNSNGSTMLSREEELLKIIPVLNDFSRALINKDSVAAIQNIFPSKRTNFQKAFQEDPALLSDIGPSFSSASMVFLSHENAHGFASNLKEPSKRLAQMNIDYHGTILPVVLIKENGTWYVRDF